MEVVGICVSLKCASDHPFGGRYTATTGRAESRGRRRRRTPPLFARVMRRRRRFGPAFLGGSSRLPVSPEIWRHQHGVASAIRTDTLLGLSGRPRKIEMRIIASTR